MIRWIEGRKEGTKARLLTVRGLEKAIRSTSPHLPLAHLLVLLLKSVRDLQIHRRAASAFLRPLRDVEFCFWPWVLGLGSLVSIEGVGLV